MVSFTVDFVLYLSGVSPLWHQQGRCRSGTLACSVLVRRRHPGKKKTNIFCCNRSTCAFPAMMSQNIRPSVIFRRQAFILWPCVYYTLALNSLFIPENGFTFCRCDVWLFRKALTDDTVPKHPRVTLKGSCKGCVLSFQTRREALMKKGGLTSPLSSWIVPWLRRAIELTFP